MFLISTLRPRAWGYRVLLSCICCVMIDDHAKEKHSTLKWNPSQTGLNTVLEQARKGSNKMRTKIMSARMRLLNEPCRKDLYRLLTTVRTANEDDDDTRLKSHVHEIHIRHCIVLSIARKQNKKAEQTSRKMRLESKYAQTIGRRCVFDPQTRPIHDHSALSDLDLWRKRRWSGWGAEMIKKKASKR